MNPSTSSHFTASRPRPKFPRPTPPPALLDLKGVKSFLLSEATRSGIDPGEADKELEHELGAGFVRPTGTYGGNDLFCPREIAQIAPIFCAQVRLNVHRARLAREEAA